MSGKFFSGVVSLWLTALLGCGLAGIASGQQIPPYVSSGALLPIILQMPENSWLKVNANFYSDVWTPAYLEPLDNGSTHTPEKIILAWSSFAWDSNRGDLIIYGGGHANYSGNDVYRWHSSTLLWERAALPSEIYDDPVAGFLAIDGVDNAPISAHTYDNNIFLPIADRFLTWGGATYDNGYFYVRVSETDPSTTRPTGPYLFDPNRADGNKVGGTTGSNVKRVDPTSIAGGQMWQNRDIFRNIANQTLPGSHTDGCAVATIEANRDVVYTAASSLFATTLDLYRYQLTDIADPTLDQSYKVGIFSVGVGGQTTCGYDPVRKLFVRAGNNSVPFQFWDLTTPSASNPDYSVQIESTIASLQSWLSAQNINIQKCALAFDPTRGTFPLWCGAGTIWELHEPASGNGVSGWTVTQRTSSGAVPPADFGTGTPGDLGTGILGKWHYAPYYDVFVGLENIDEGQIWIYKPVGWVQPIPAGDVLPSVSITSPADGTTVVPGTTIALNASASDPGGGIARVEYYANGVKLGQATVAPYNLIWTPILVGSYSLVAVAVDNVGGMKLSATVQLVVDAPLTTVTLQRGLNGYAGVSDTYLDQTAPTFVRGASNPLYLDLSNYTTLVRFAIFQSEGGPVPNGAVLQSATLQLYKQYYNDTLQLNALLKPWVESQATWNVSQAGTNWSAGGAGGAGTDYAISADDVLTPSWNPGWVAFDVTDRVQQWSSNSSANFGWRLMQTTTGGNPKTFYSSEYTTDTTLRPTLTIVYSGGTANVPPTVTLLTPANGASVTLGSSFTLTASASDANGSVTKVDYYAGSTKIGTATVSPYTVVWTPSAAGSYVLTAVATDNGGLTGTSNAATVTVNASSGTTVTLQRGLNAYAGVSDTYLDGYLQTTAHGGDTSLYLDSAHYTPLVRFAIFQNEGGPIPAGATIQSATLQLYKQYYDDTVRLNALLKNWSEGQATWRVSQTGTNWTVAGAAGAGTDYNSTNDALVSVPFNPGWVAFDVTNRVQQWANGSGTNYGWRIGATSAVNAKIFDSSEYATDATLRPKLTVVYSGGGTANVPPTATLLTPANGASITLGSSFTLTASASDANGSVTKVEYYAGSTKIGTATVSPYTVVWTPSAAGGYVLTAVATDNGGLTGTSNAASVTVTGTVTLQRGLNAYAGVSDTYLDGFNKTTVHGGDTSLYLDSGHYTPLIRFAIFQNEGGPVPAGATIQSATLQLYKQYYDDTVRLNALLKNWIEGQATWRVSQTGTNWSVLGASGAGTDYNSTNDALVSVPFNPGWVAFDVTNRVQQWANGNGTNYGWRLGATSSVNAKIFDSSEYATDATLRPKLTIVYH